jgi:hypothetical protein
MQSFSKVLHSCMFNFLIFFAIEVSFSLQSSWEVTILHCICFLLPFFFLSKVLGGFCC